MQTGSQKWSGTTAYAQKQLTITCEETGESFEVTVPDNLKIYPAFVRWKEVRDKVGMALPEQQAIFYLETTKEQENSFTEIIESLDLSRIHPALDWDGHTYKYYRNLPYYSRG